jgi:hypothetical protein
VAFQRKSGEEEWSAIAARATGGFWGLAGVIGEPCEGGGVSGPCFAEDFGVGEGFFFGAWFEDIGEVFGGIAAEDVDLDVAVLETCDGEGAEGFRFVIGEEAFEDAGPCEGGVGGGIGGEAGDEGAGVGGAVEGEEEWDEEEACSRGVLLVEVDEGGVFGAGGVELAVCVEGGGEVGAGAEIGVGFREV